MKLVGRQHGSHKGNIRVTTIPKLGVFRQRKIVEFFDSDRRGSGMTYKAFPHAIEGRMFAPIASAPARINTV